MSVTVVTRPSAPNHFYQHPVPEFDLTSWSYSHRPVHPLYVPELPTEEAFRRVWNNELPLAYANVDLPWAPDRELFSEGLAHPNYIGVHCRIKIRDSRHEQLEQFHDELIKHLPAFGLERGHVPEVAERLVSFCARTVRAGDENGFRDHVLRLSGTQGEDRGDGLWHCDRQNQAVDKSLRTIATLYSIPMASMNDAFALSGSTLVFPNELLPEERREILSRILSSRTPKEDWRHVFARINSEVEAWIKDDFQSFQIPTLPIGKPAIFKGGRGGLLHRAPRFTEIAYRVLFSHNSRIKGEEESDDL